jgi:hypothetical protein
MSTPTLRAPQVLHRLPGRLRVHLPAWRGPGCDALEAGLRRLPGVRGARANPLTGNALISFDPRVVTETTLLARVGGLSPAPAAGPWHAPAPRAPGGLPGGLRGLVRGAVVDVLIHAVICAEPFGLPLTGLWVLQLGLDVVSWGAALVPLLEGGRRTRAGDGAGRPARASAA